MLQIFAKAAGSHLGCEAVRALIPLLFPGRNALCAGSPSGKAAHGLLGVSFVGWRNFFCTAKRGAAETRVSQPEAGLTDQPSCVSKMVGSLGVGKSRKLTWQIPFMFNNKLCWGTWG